MNIVQSVNVNWTISSPTYTVKKVFRFPVPSRVVTDQTLPGQEKNNYFPSRESLVSDIPAGDGKIFNLFFSVGLRFRGTFIEIMYSMYLYMKIFMIKNPPSPLFGGSSSNTFKFGKS